MPDYPSSEGYTAATLKTAFDAPATGLKGDINRLETELEDTSSASNLGASPIVVGDDSDANVQAKLEKLYADMQGITQGDVLDGSITQVKLDSTYEATLAKKDGALQTGLNSEQLNGKTEAELKTAFLDGLLPTTLSFSKLSGGSGTATETKTVATSGCRYYILATSYYKVILYDAKSNKFVFAIPTRDQSEYRDYSYNTSTVPLYNYSNSVRATLSASYSNGTLTINMTKATSVSSQDIPAGTIVVFELGGIV